MLLHHGSEMMGGHPGVRDTTAKIAAYYHWPSLEHDVNRWCSTCPVCKVSKPSPALTSEQRTELYERPFRMLFMDTLGPISPPDGEYRYIAHVECPFTRYVWLQPLRYDSADEWARFLVEHVFFDVAGFPAVLRSDRGKAFTSDVVQAVNKMLNIEHAFGTAYHPQSQGYV